MKRLLLPTVLSLFMAVSQAQETLHPGWQSADIGPGVKPSFDFDALDQLHVMGMTETGGGVVWHAKAPTIAGPWTPVDVATGYFYGPGDLRTDPSGNAHLAWHDHDSQSPHHVVVAPDGRTTDYILVSDGQHDGWDNSLFVDAGGTVHMACVDPSSFGAAHGLQYASFDGTAWTFNRSVSGSDSFMYGLNTSIVVDASGTPHVLYCQSGDWLASGKLVHATAGSPEWIFETIDSGDAVGRFPTLAIDGSDNLHATWLDIDPSDSDHGTIQYGFLPAEGGAWQITLIDTFSAVHTGFSHARKSASIAVDVHDFPHVAYSDTESLRYAVMTLDGWQTTSVLSHTEGIYKSLAVLRLDSTGRPAIAMWQSNEEGDTVRLLRQRPATTGEGELDLGLEIEAGLVSYTTGGAGTYQLQTSTDLKTWLPVGEPVVTDRDPTVIRP
ncbi:MAG: hypothetical protein ACI9MB_003894 [Verrucomicrobiales bacterium]|jgi:hypothetical protein